VHTLVQGGLFANRQFTDFANNLKLMVLYWRRGRVTPVTTPANIKAVRMALIRSPSKSTRSTSAELGISRRSLQRILHSDLHLFPYKITVTHKLPTRQGMEATVCIMGNGKRGRTSQHMVYRRSLLSFKW